RRARPSAALDDSRFKEPGAKLVLRPSRVKDARRSSGCAASSGRGEERRVAGTVVDRDDEREDGEGRVDEDRSRIREREGGAEVVPLVPRARGDLRLERDAG